MSANRIFRSRASGDEEYWIPVSDLMAGLMIIFLFIAITYIRPILNERNTVKEILVAWDQTEGALFDRLDGEFAGDFKAWNAELDRPTLSVRFKAPEILFNTNEATLRSKFKKILDEFFPRYLMVLNEFHGSLAEVRIEGHTSSEWADVDPDEAYFLNMRLSQERTRTVLRYCLEMPTAAETAPWARHLITANGLSSSKPILVDGVQDRDASRRVEFRVRTKAKQQIVKILETVEWETVQ